MPGDYMDDQPPPARAPAAAQRMLAGQPGPQCHGPSTARICRGIHRFARVSGRARLLGGILCSFLDEASPSSASRGLGRHLFGLVSCMSHAPQAVTGYDAEAKLFCRNGRCTRPQGRSGQLAMLEYLHSSATTRTYVTRTATCVAGSHHLPLQLPACRRGKPARPGGAGGSSPDARHARRRL